MNSKYYLLIQLCMKKTNLVNVIIKPMNAMIVNFM